MIFLENLKLLPMKFVNSVSEVCSHLENGALWVSHLAILDPPDTISF
jgi:hypothetical protein